MCLFLQDVEVEKDSAEEDRHKTLEEMEDSRKEQDDLLVLLSDQETRIKKYRKKLKELGHTVSSFLLTHML